MESVFKRARVYVSEEEEAASRLGLLLTDLGLAEAAVVRAKTSIENTRLVLSQARNRHPVLDNPNLRHRVLACLDFGGAYRCARVNRSWLQSALSESLWKELAEARFPSVTNLVAAGVSLPAGYRAFYRSRMQEVLVSKEVADFACSPDDEYWLLIDMPNVMTTLEGRPVSRAFKLSECITYKNQNWFEPEICNCVGECEHPSAWLTLPMQQNVRSRFFEGEQMVDFATEEHFMEIFHYRIAVFRISDGKTTLVISGDHAEFSEAENMVRLL
jgi:hypothetical protein